MVKLFRYEPNRGKGYAIKTGVLQAQGKYILFADAGGCVPYEDIEEGLQLLEQGYDLSFGSRALADSKVLVRQPFYRRLGSKGFAFVVRYILGIKDVRDTQCGFKLFRQDVARKLFDIQRTDGFMFDVEIVLNAKQHGYRLKEFPVRWSSDPDSRFKPIQGTIRQTIQILRILWYCR